MALNFSVIIITIIVIALIIAIITTIPDHRPSSSSSYQFISGVHEVVFAPP
jgi:hypothetical protein